MNHSTVVAWYGALPDALGRLVGDVQARAAATLGEAFVARDPGQVHATLIGLERAPDPFDPEPLAAHLCAMLAQPRTVRFGGFTPSDRRLLSRGATLHDRGFFVSGDKVVLVGWPWAAAGPRADLADIRAGCAAFGVTHRYGADDPDAYLVVGDVAPGVPPASVSSLETSVRRELAASATHVPLSAADLALVTYANPALPRESTSWRPLFRIGVPRDRDS